MCFCLCGCNIEPEDTVLGAYGTEEQKQQIKLDEVTLLYYPDLDTNPITTTCLANNQVSKLVYRPLITVNEKFEPTPVLAESFSQHENVVTVKLRQGLTFSNGEPLTAHHAVKSFEAAKKNATSPYNASAMQMSRFSAKDDYTFECVFKTVFADAAALMDIPIMYNGKDAVGCGPYKFETDSGKQYLVKNEHYSTSATLQKISLAQTKTDSYITTMFSAGELDIVSIPGNDDLTLTSLRDYSIVKYPSNNMLYIGVNTASELFALPETRRALSSVIDRDKIASQTLAGLAKPADSPFNPDWYRLENITVEKQSADLSLLSGKKFTLVVPEGSDVKNAVAGALVKQFESAGITLVLETVTVEDYKLRVASGNFELYLGETAVPRTMDPTYLYGVGGSMNYTAFYSEQLENAYATFKATGEGLADYLTVFDSQMPVIPIAFKMNAIYCANGLDGFEGSSAWDSYGNFEKVYIK